MIELIKERSDNMKSERIKLYTYSLVALFLVTPIFSLVYQGFSNVTYGDLFFRVSLVGILAVFATIQFVEDLKKIFIIKSMISILGISLLFSLIRRDSDLSFWAHWIITFINSSIMIPVIYFIKGKIKKQH